MNQPPSANKSSAIGGANQTNVRAHNERLVLTLVRRFGSLPSSEIARRSGLSAQTVSVIIRALEADGLLLRGTPQRGRVGQPSVPLMLNPDGAYSIGLKIGRRSAELVLVNFLGEEKLSIRQTIDYPMPVPLLEFVDNEFDNIKKELTKEQQKSIAGIGLAMPFELWNWADKVGAPANEMDVWRDKDFALQIQELTGCPVLLKNDATAACGAELLFGHGSHLNNFIYMFVGTFIGGGVVLNNSVYPGTTGYAGALSPMQVTGPSGEQSSLIDCASIYTLEMMLQKNNIDSSPLWECLDDWSMLGPVVTDWIETTGYYLAVAIVSSCAVIDFEAAVVDGALPASVKAQLVSSIEASLDIIDTQGIIRPKVYEGLVGPNARSLGAATLPLTSR